MVNPVLVINNKNVSNSLKIYRIRRGQPGVYNTKEEVVAAGTPMDPLNPIWPVAGDIYDHVAYGVHKHPGGVYMTGEYHTPGSLLLDLQMINTAQAGFIQDFRVFPQVEGASQSDEGFQSLVSGMGPGSMLKHLTNDTPAIDTTTSHFSDLCLTRDIVRPEEWAYQVGPELAWKKTGASGQPVAEEYFRFFFSMNFFGILTQNTVLGSFLSPNSKETESKLGMLDAPEIFDQFLNSSKIISFKLLRKKVEVSSGLNSAGLTHFGVKDSDKNQEPVLVATWEQKHPMGHPHPTTAAEMLAHYRESGKIRAVNLKTHGGPEARKYNTEPYLKHFSGEEELVPVLSDVEKNITAPSMTVKTNAEGDKWLVDNTFSRPDTVPPSGFWHYYLEMDVQDGTIEWLSAQYNLYSNSVLTVLENLYAMAIGYDIHGKPYYDSINDEWVGPPGQSRIAKDIEIYNFELYKQLKKLTMGVFFDDFIPGGASSDKNLFYRYFLLSFMLQGKFADQKYTAAIGYGLSRTQMMNQSSKFIKLITPAQGTPTSIKAVLDHVRTTMKSLEAFLNAHAGGSVRKQETKTVINGVMQSESPARYNIAAKRSFKVEHHFDQAQEILNFDLPSGVGYDYLNYLGAKEGGGINIGGISYDYTGRTESVITARDNLGLTNVSPRSYASRIFNELRRNFRPNGFTGQPGDLETQEWPASTFLIHRITPTAGEFYSTEINLVPNSFSYLTPSIVNHSIERPGMDASERTFLTGDFPYDTPTAFGWRKYYNLFTKILLFNASHNVLSTTPGGSNSPSINTDSHFTKILSTRHQRTRNSLIDIYAEEFNCTVENMDSFRKRRPPILSSKEQQELNAHNSAVISDDTVELPPADPLPPGIGPQSTEDGYDLPDVISYKYEAKDTSPEMVQISNIFMNLNIRPNSGFGGLHEKNWDLNMFDPGPSFVDLLPSQVKALFGLFTNKSTYEQILKHGTQASQGDPITEDDWDLQDAGEVNWGKYPQHLMFSAQQVYSSEWDTYFSMGPDSWDTHFSTTKVFKSTMPARLFPFCYFRFFKINEVQALSHYDMLPNGTINMKAPIYNRLTNERVTEINNSPAATGTDGGQTVCRQVAYNNSSVNIFEYPELNLPTYNEYFFLGPGYGPSTSPGYDMFNLGQYAQFISGEATGKKWWY